MIPNTTGVYKFGKIENSDKTSLCMGGAGTFKPEKLQ